MEKEKTIHSLFWSRSNANVKRVVDCLRIQFLETTEIILLRWFLSLFYTRGCGSRLTYCR